MKVGYMIILPSTLSNFNCLDNGMSYKLQVKSSTDQAVITVPKSLRNAKGWEDGEELEWQINDEGSLELTES